MPMSETHLEPAKSVIAKIGIEKVSDVTGKHVSRVYRWMYPKERGGTGGFIPQADAQLILQHARANSIPLSASEFLEPLLGESGGTDGPTQPAPEEAA